MYKQIFKNNQDAHKHYEKNATALTMSRKKVRSKQRDHFLVCSGYEIGVVKEEKG